MAAEGRAAGRKVVVFGGTGFLGGHVADRLSELGYEVVIADLERPASLARGQRFAECSVVDLDRVTEVVAGADYVYNFAAIADIDETVERPLSAVRVNVLGNTHVLEACRRHRVRRFVFASSVYVYSRHGSFYRSTKQACEKIIENYQEHFGVDFTILRYGSLYGPRANRFNSLHKYVHQALAEGKITRLGDGEEMREYIHVLDAAKGSVLALGEDYRNRYLMITGMQAFKVRDVLSMIREIMDHRIEIEYLPPAAGPHYVHVPYSFRPARARRLVMSEYYDLGQGLLDLMYEVEGERDADGGAPERGT
jgi:UDP-glucose 4-epimerase